MGWVLCLMLALPGSGPFVSAADGTFRGRVIDPPVAEAPLPGWIFVQGRNRMLRRVEVAHAVIVFGDEIPVKQRHKCNAECLGPGQEVRITARQDSAGEWRAKRVEILKLASRLARIPRKPTPLPIFTPKLAVKRITSVNDSASHRIRDKSI
jgi:hypothetical protein